MSANPSPRVLYVDPGEDCRDMLSTALRIERIEARAVANAAEALSFIQAERFDLYLLETWLPDLDGFELCRQMRNFNPLTPILFFSSAAYGADKRKGIEAGANAYVTKPDVGEVVARIRQFVFPAQSAVA